MADSIVLHSRTVQQSRATINRLHILFHFTTVLFLLYYRTTNLFHEKNVPTLAWSLVTVSELIIAFIWFLSQGFRWLPVSRSVFPEKGPSDVKLPAIDVFVCTADAKKEPTVEVMNTVISAVGLDYPSQKLSVYLSDDGGSQITSYAIKEACEFAKSWIPFCRKYGIKTRCPEAYFSLLAEDERLLSSGEFKVEENNVKSKYEIFKRNVENVGEKDENNQAQMDRPPRVEILHDNKKDEENNEDKNQMPMLVYVSRDRRPSYPHRFKAGAINTLLRVSGIISNAPYLLVLDCDMYCNDPTSARQAMCFHLDAHMSPSLAFVQYPQIFYNVSKNDIYDGQARSAYTTKWQGMDGLTGPLLLGIGFYLKRNALFGSPNQEGATLGTFWNEQTIWLIRSVSGSLFGCLDVIMKRIGIQKGKFRLTNKAVDKEKLEKCEKGRFNFQGAATFMIPLTFLVILNLICLSVGLRRVILEKNIEVMFGQVFLSSYHLALSYSILEGLIPSKRKRN